MASDTPHPLSFSDFLERMKDPAAADLVRNIKSFIKQFEDRPKSYVPNLDADSVKVQEFMARSEQLFRTHPVWRGSLPAVLDQAVEGLEKYVMSKVWRQTFGVGQEERDRDERYARLARALGGFVTLAALMGVEGVAPDPALLAMAQGELLKMDKYKAPRDKLLCLVNVKTMVENIVQEAARKGARIGGADAFFPVFLFVVIRSCLPHLASNVEYVKRFRMASRLTGQFDYMLCNLESAAVYLDTVNYEHLHISQDDFLARLAAAGIPEADLELRRLQKVRQAQLRALEGAGGAAGGGVAGSEGGLPSPHALEAYLRRQQEQQAAGAGDVCGAEAESGGGAVAAVAGVPHPAGSDGQLQQQAGGGEAASQQQGDPSQPASLLTTPGGSMGGDGLLAAAAAAATPPRTPGSAAAAAAGEDGALEGEEEAAPMLPAAAGSPGEPGLSPLLGQPSPGNGEVVGAAALLEAAGNGLSLSDTLRRQLFEEGAQPGAAAASEQPPEPSPEPSFVEDMVLDGARYVLEQEAAGRLQRKYPYMYAAAEDLTLGDVQRVLAAYKALILRYEALALSLTRQLGPTAPTPATAAQQQQHNQQHAHAGNSSAAVQLRASSALLGVPAASQEALPGAAAVGPEALLAGATASSMAAAAAAASAASERVGSPTRRSLFQRITSRGRSSSSKEEGSAVSPMAPGLQRSSPSSGGATSPSPSRWRGAVEGSAGSLFGTLFGSPQRQASRKSQDGDRPSSAPSSRPAPGEGTVLMQPLPAPVAAAVAAPPRPAAPSTSAGTPAAPAQPAPPLVPPQQEAGSLADSFTVNPLLMVDPSVAALPPEPPAAAAAPLLGPGGAPAEPALRTPAAAQPEEQLAVSEPEATAEQQQQQLPQEQQPQQQQQGESEAGVAGGASSMDSGDSAPSHLDAELGAAGAAANDGAALLELPAAEGDGEAAALTATHPKHPTPPAVQSGEEPADGQPAGTAAEGSAQGAAAGDLLPDIGGPVWEGLELSDGGGAPAAAPPAQHGEPRGWPAGESLI